MAKKRGATVRRGGRRVAKPKRAAPDAAAGKPAVPEAPNIPPSIGNATIDVSGAFAGTAFDSTGFDTGRPQRAPELNPAVRSTTTGVNQPLLPLRSAEPNDQMSDPATGEPMGSRLARGLTNLVNDIGDEDAGTQAIDRTLSQHPADIRDSMRALSREFEAQIDELKAVWPNDQDRADAYEDLVALFERMAKGLADLADALDAAINNATNGAPEPVFLGKAGEIARGLQRVLMKWLDESGTMVIERPVRITLFSLGVAFLHSIGADGAAAIAGLTAVVLNKGAPSAGGNSKRPRSRSSGR